MRCLILGFVGGSALLQLQPALPGATTLAWLVLPGCLLALGQHRMRARWRRVMPIGVGALAGFCWAAIVATRALAPGLAPQDEGRDVTVTGTIDSLPSTGTDSIRFHFAVETVQAPSRMAVPPRIALSWYGGDSSPAQAVRPGQRWQLKVRLQRPHGNANPGGFDYELWLLEQGVRATGYVRNEGPNRRLAAFVPTPHNIVERARDRLRERILAALAQQPYAGVIVALVVGDQRGIGQADWQVFTRTGIGHLVSISGLHITMIAGLAAGIASWLWRHSFLMPALQLPLRLPAQKVAALAGMLAALGYVLLAGFGVPAQRTLYMLGVVALALWTGRLPGVTHVLALAAGVVVLLDPWAVMWPGFWLSFGAVALILYATVGRTAAYKQAPPADAAPGETRRGRPLSRHQRLLRALHGAALTQYAVTLGLVPLTMLLFAQVSVVSPLANTVAIPVVSLLVTPLALAGGVLPEPFATPLLLAAHWVIELLAGLLQWLSAGRLAVWTAPAPPWWAFALALAGTFWLLAPRGWPNRWLGLATWVPLLAAQPEAPAAGTLRIVAFDVGQGMAVLVETSGHRLLYDTGPAYGPDADAGSRVIAPYLRWRGIDRLDGVVVSHGDTDHVGGALSLLRAVPAGWLLSSLPALHPVVQAAPRHVPCAAGQGWTWDGIRFEVLHPSAASHADSTLKSNARSCTLRIAAPGGAVLLAGDIEAPQEVELLARAPAKLRADILLAPHHGSGTSSTPAFLAAVQPSVAIFQVGYRNRYRHPKAAVYERYGALGVQRVRTDEAGAVVIEIDAGVRTEEHRTVHRRYWLE
ncbi:DNA internalization-related competence protein ComEC/Rec2 [Pseudoduganella armeniaca]|uniref:DNA internalization-related competence protein ComEC/Rec2 n=1 Tax=Pseudoduganella armeniaca TaxID=2072590 RepID=A0A2R4CAV2_9BURK|nr:DNA internalization-related competence protein ComEC/Rec2 [Pseudoduganella armeniaca]AVR96733.1 DNA internalization-related competence protein ComEC/Rec2 [Pseudoduganella armeniaca]